LEHRGLAFRKSKLFRGREQQRLHLIRKETRQAGPLDVKDVPTRAAGGCDSRRPQLDGAGRARRRRRWRILTDRRAGRPGAVWPAYDRRRGEAPCTGLYWGCEGPESRPVAWSHRPAGRQARGCLDSN